MLKFHTFGANQEGGISFQRSLCTRNITEIALHKPTNTSSEPCVFKYSHNLTVTLKKKISTACDSIIFAGVLKWKGTGNNYEGHGNTAWGPRKVRAKCYRARGRGAVLHFLLWVWGLAPSGPHPRFVDTASAGLLQLTLQLVITVTRVHSCDCLVNSSLEMEYSQGMRMKAPSANTKSGSLEQALNKYKWTLLVKTEYLDVYTELCIKKKDNWQRKSPTRRKYCCLVLDY